MEAALQRLEILIHHMGASKEVVSEAFIAACNLYAQSLGFDLKKDWMFLHRAVVPSVISIDENANHILIRNFSDTTPETVIFCKPKSVH